MRCGIDPGVTGALAFLNSNLECIAISDMPVIAVKKGKNRVNGAELAKIFERWRAQLHEPMIVFLENVHTMPGQGIASSGNFMRDLGVVEGVLAAERVPYIMVTPQHWKKRAGLLKTDKDMARVMAQRLYPDLDLSRKKDIGKSDALLIARFGERMEK